MRVMNVIIVMMIAIIAMMISIIAMMISIIGLMMGVKLLLTISLLIPINIFNHSIILLIV